MTENKRRVIKKQLLLLLEELETKPELSYDAILNSDKNIYDEDWNKLVDKLNAVPNGAKRFVPRWKEVLINWKTTVKSQADSNKNSGRRKGLDDTGKRLLKLVESEVLHQKNDNNEMSEIVVSATDNENDVFRRPMLKIMGKKRPKLVISGLGEGSLLNQQKRMKGLTTIYDNNTDRENNPEQRIITMQLNKLQHISQELENHIQQVQDRIQTIKDMWQHRCVEEHA